MAVYVVKGERVVLFKEREDSGPRTEGSEDGTASTSSANSSSAVGHHGSATSPGEAGLHRSASGGTLSEWGAPHFGIEALRLPGNTSACGTSLLVREHASGKWLAPCHEPRLKP